MLVGDPCQLRPTVLSDIGGKYNLGLSLYERLHSTLEQKNGSVTMLTTQYRMHSAICQLPSKAFYKNRLKTHPTVDEDMEHFPLQPLYLYDIINSKQSVDHTYSSYNIEEVDFVIRFCKMLATDINVWKSLIAADSEEFKENSISNIRPIVLDDARSIDIQQRIAVITPYQAQIHHFQQRLPRTIELMTADSAQGSEKDIVIISCVCSHGPIGFLSDQSWLNVMLTRAKYGLYIVGNLTWLALKDNYWRDLIDDAQKRKILHCVGENMPSLPKRVQT
jgi:senataxin